MKLFTAILVAATIATQNAVIAQTTTTPPTEMTMTPTAEDGTMMTNNLMQMGSTNGDMSTDMSGDSDTLAGSTDSATSETAVGSENGSGNGSGKSMNAGGNTATTTSGAVSIQSITLTMSALVAGLAATFVF
ncbi:unnamed protein product [Peronospora farinosa]|uniref:Uncharacterized protein n=1 Tax=Peronospora farinosa TaxID=134698 RepID=A0AAV0T194_9STRA|nr:unnamed protein product [Peronospora farinosa]CAI5712598.1 unnamed protein product [Peronospora farinosa]